MPLETGILATKLYRPRTRGDRVPRPRLLEHLDRRRERPLTLVVAPAGYGKTTLVATWLETVDCPSAWLSLDEEDSDLAVFLSYFLAALQTILPDAGGETLMLLKAIPLPPLPVLARTLVNELDQVERPFILVLDDYHHINNIAVHDLLDKLLRHPPRALHLVLTSRSDPLLPLTRLRACSLVTEIRWQELRFTEAETAAFLRQELGTPADDATVTAFVKQVEGWVTGLRLLILSMRHRGSGDLAPARLQGRVGYVADYLMGEVLESLPQARRDRLLQTAILDRFCAPLCQAMAGSDGSEMTGWAFLDWLRAANPFVIPLDDERRWYRYHHLFQELLKHRLEQRLMAGEIAALHAQASAWLAQNSLIDEALHHALAAGEPDTAVQLVDQHRHTLIDREQWQRLERWLRLFPRPFIDECPELLMTKAWTLWWRGQFERLEVTLDQVQDRISQKPLAPESAERIAGEISLLQSNQVAWMADGPQSLSLAQSALERLPAEWEYAHFMAVGHMSLAYQFLGEKQRAYESIYRALGESHWSERCKSRFLIAICMLHWADADLLALEQTSKNLIGMSQEFDLPQSLAMGHYFLGCAHYHRNQLSLAEQHLAVAYGARSAIFMNFLVHGTLALSLTYQASGRPEQARETVDETYEFFHALQNYRLMLATRAAQADLALRQNRIGEAVHWAQDYDPQPLLMLHPFYMSQLTLVKVLLAKDTDASRQQAANLLAQLCEFLERSHNTRFQIEVLALQALLDDIQGNEPAALEKLEQAVRLAEPGGWIRLFVDLGPRVAGLLERLVQRGVAPDYIAQILDVFPKPAARMQSPGGGQQTTAQTGSAVDDPISTTGPQFTTASSSLIEPLTNRELEVLALLEQRLTNKEIAALLFISPETVKRHASTIYQKLAVKNRRQAVAKAKSLGIVRLPS